MLHLTTIHSFTYLGSTKPHVDAVQIVMRYYNVVIFQLSSFAEVLSFELVKHVNKAGVTQEWPHCLHG